MSVVNKSGRGRGRAGHAETASPLGNESREKIAMAEHSSAWANFTLNNALFSHTPIVRSRHRGSNPHTAPSLARISWPYNLCS